MKRRDFIKMGSFITVSVAALGVTACGSSAPSDVPPSAEDDSLLSPNPVRAIPTAATGANWKFPQSIASGDPKSDSIMLWTRVVPTSLTDIEDSSTDTAVTLEVTAIDNSASFGSTTALTGTLLATVTVPAYGVFDGTIRHKLTGLSANTTYFYQFVAGTVRSKVGRFKTAPAASSTADVKFAFMSCQDWSDNHWGAFSQIVADDGAGSTPSLDFIVHLGDYIYEKHGASTAESLHSTLTMPSGEPFATETSDYRYLYKTFRSDLRLQALHERFPMIAVWDDHEFSDDSWQDHQTYGLPDMTDNSNPEEKDRRRSANQAWFEYTPADIAYSETTSSFKNIRIYRDLKFGQTVHLIMTDERLYRADHMIPESTAKPGITGAAAALPANQLGRINSRYLAPEASYKQLEAIKYGIGTDPLSLMTMLGTNQRQWWKDTMAGSTAKWKVWGNEVSLLRMGLNGNQALIQLIPLGIFGALTSASESTGIAQIPAQVSTALVPQLVSSSLGLPASATPAWVTVIVGLASSVGTLLATNHSVPPASASAAAQGLLAQTAGYIASQESNGDAAMLAYAKASLTAGVAASGIPGLSSGEADSVAPSAVGIYKQAVALGNLVIATAVTAAIGQGASTTLAGQGAYAITATSTSTMDLVNLTAAGQAAGLTATQAGAAAGAFLNAISVGNITIVSAIAGAGTAGANTTLAAQAAFAITATDAAYPGNATALTGAATTAGLTATEADSAVAAYLAAKAAKAAGTATQITAAANQIAFVKAQPDIRTNKANSVFFLKAAGGSAAAVAGFFQKFLLNADQWDGYSKERKELMNFLIEKNIKDVVAVTGDIHSFYAGQVYNDYPGEVSSYAIASGSAYETGAYATGTPAMVDLVTAGISSTSWFNYIKQAVDVLDPTNALIGKLVYIPVPSRSTTATPATPINIPANAFYTGSPAVTFDNDAVPPTGFSLNLLDYAMGKTVPADTATLAAQLTDQIKRGLAKAGVVEAALAGATAAIQAQIAGSAAFTSALGLAQTLATKLGGTLDTPDRPNPWLKHVDAEAQGYAVVTATTTNLTCDFKKLNPLVGTTAPTGIVASTKTATIAAGSTNITMS